MAAVAAVGARTVVVVEEVHTVVEAADLTGAAEVRTEAVLTDGKFLQLRPAPIFWGGPFFCRHVYDTACHNSSAPEVFTRKGETSGLSRLDIRKKPDRATFRMRYILITSAPRLQIQPSEINAAEPTGMPCQVQERICI